MRGTVAKMLRKKAHEFWLLKRYENPDVTVRMIYKRMKKLFMQGHVK